MATETSSIDELLMGGQVQAKPEIPQNEPEINEDIPEDTYDEPASEQQPSNEQNESHDDDEVADESEDTEEKQEYDDYGNEKAKPRTYTEEEHREILNRTIRERLARGNNSAQQPTQQQVQQQTQGFEYNPDSEQSLAQQLEVFVEQTVNRMSEKQQHQQKALQEQQADEVFRDKFTQGMEKFSDFRSVVESQPISDPMTLALRGMKDPAAFIYAASKRHATELQRISQISDPYSQIVEMGKLEERMRKSPVTTKAPKPMSRTREDATLPVSKKSKEPSIEDLIAKSDAKRRAQLTARRGR